MLLSQDEFVSARKSDWDDLRALLDAKRLLHKLPPTAISRVAALYRAVCGDLMRAEANGYGPDVIALLDGLAARAHNAIYEAPRYRFRAVRELLEAEFPRSLRRHGRLFALGVALFLLPGVLGFVGGLRSRAFALQILPQGMVAEMETQYGEGFNGRSADTDAGMAGYYVFNNVGIAFRCFATGILFGIGSAFFLVYNGLVTGVVFGLVTAAGHGRNLLSFTCTHGAFELTAIVIAGTAGMVMGYALIDTGGRTRFGALRAKSRDIVNLVMGAAAMLLVAAAIEGFWSPSSVRAPIKWGAAVAAYLFVAVYLARAGRRGQGGTRP
jgi:uncharacterized membrane protein SpoIIM required for sporulation